jgi:HEAT repeat protein
MTVSGPRHTLPAGVLPTGHGARSEDAGSHVRPKAPEPPSRGRSDVRSGHRATPAERAQSLVAQLVTLGPSEIAPVVRRLLPLGNFALDEIARCFPEPLWCPSHPIRERLPRPDEISATAAALATFEEEAVPYLIRLMRHPRSLVRYHAMLVCAMYSHSALIQPLAQAALDGDRECRRMAVHLLSTHQLDPTYRGALGSLRRQATEVTRTPEERRRAISALTQLRDEASVALFVDLLAAPERPTASAARVGLRVLTAHDFGFSREAWLRWLSERGRSARVEWLIEGLGDGRANVRMLASTELWAMTRLLEPLCEGDARDAFLSAQRRYESWWKEGQRP